MSLLKPRYLLIWLFVFLLAMLFTNLGANGLLEDNEARFYEISHSMARSGDWLTPRLSGVVHFHKPPLTFWAVGSSLRVFGYSEWAGRLPVALASLLLVCLTGFLQKRPLEGSLWTALILVTSVEYWFLSRLVLTDMFLALTVGLALFAFWRLKSSDSARWAVLFWVSLGLSFLTKGPVGLAVVSLTGGFYSLLGGKYPWKRLFQWGPVLTGVGVATPWYLLACLKFPGLFSYLFFFQTVDRVSTEVHGRGGPIWFYLPVILLGFFPWSGALWVALREAWKRRDDFDRLLLAWVIGPLCLFSLSGSKLPTYLLPLFPALALLVSRVIEKERSRRQAAISCALGFAAFSVALVVFIEHGLPPELLAARFELLAVGVASSVGSSLSLCLTCCHRDREALATVGLSFAVVLLFLSGGLAKCDASYSSRELSGALVSAGLDQDVIVAEYKDHLHGLPVYLGRRVVQISFPRETRFEQDDEYKPFLFKDLESFRNSLAPDQKFLLIMSKSDYDEKLFPGLVAERIGRWFVLRSQPGDGDLADS